MARQGEGARGRQGEGATARRAEDSTAEGDVHKVDALVAPQRLEAIAANEIQWLVDGEIPKAAVTLLSGEPGSGKSFVACTLAASVSQLSDAHVLFAHSDPAERLHSRLMGAGADASRVLGIGDQGPGVREGFGIQDSGFSMPADAGQAFQPDAAGPPGVENAANRSHNPKRPERSGFRKGFTARLDALIAALGAAAANFRALAPSPTRALDPPGPVNPPRAVEAAAKPIVLIVIDDLESWCGKELSAGELADATASLNELARASGAAVLVVVRSTTTTEGRVTGRSLDRLLRAADVAWMVAADREATGRRWLVPLKNNLAAPPAGKAFQIVEGRVQWLNEAVPDDALMPGSRRSAERADRQTACAWLIEALRDHDLPSRMLYAHARQCGYSRNTILRAAHKMGMHSHKSAFDGGWKYSLRDVPSEVLERFRPKPKVFGIQDSAFGEGFRVQGSAEHSGFGIRDSAEAADEAVPPDAAGPSDLKNAENCSKSPKAPKAEGDGEKRIGRCEGFGIQGSGTRVPQAVGQAFQPDVGGSIEVKNAENCSKSPKAPNTNHQSPTAVAQGGDGRLESLTYGAQATVQPKKPLGPSTLPPDVPPEPELRDHLGRQTAKSVEAWERWYHQWHPVVREFNPNYQFET